MGVETNNKPDRRPRIFIVDDEPILLELAEKILSNLPCEIQTFVNPEAALREYSAHATWPDLVITDFAMHQMNGMHLIRACRRLNPKQKIIMVSGTVDESIFAESEAKPNRFLAKPYLPKSLTEMVQELLVH